jgi:predicted amidohydrolase
METILNILTVQADLKWEDKEKNRRHLFDLANPSAKKSDLIILPEMFNTGFTMNTALAESMDGESIVFLKQKSSEYQSLIITSLTVKENNSVYNRLVAVFPDGNIQYYDKRHLFSLAGEERYYNRGNKHLIINYKGWKIMPLVCYDLRFPVWARNQYDYDLLIYVANWPHRRHYAWQQLLIARAIENEAFVAGVNRIGKDNNGIDHSGDTMVIDYAGEKISHTQPFEERAELISLKRENRLKFVEKFNFLADKDNFEIS